MSLQVYINKILEPVVKPWLLEKQDFVSEENGDSGHGKAKNRNIVRQWKEKITYSIFLIVLHLLIFLLLRIAGSLLSNISRNFHT